MSTLIQEIQQRLQVALTANKMAKEGRPEGNPLEAASLDMLIQNTSTLKHADLLPQKDKHGNWMGPDNLNQAVVDGLEARKNARQNQRKTRARAAAARKQQIDAIADSPVAPDPVRLAKAWAVMRPMTDIMARIARSKASWAKRYLGTVGNDICQEATCKMVLVLAKGTHDLDVLMIAAEQLAGEAKRKGAIPGVQEDKEAKKERKAEAKARKLLMGMANNRVMGALCDAYTDRHNLKWENLDIIETVMASINGAGDDPMTARFQADKAPSFLGTKMAAPGVLDRNILAMALAAAITDRRLDALVELITHEDNLRTDGTFMWKANAERVFTSTTDGEHKWELVYRATVGHADPERSRAQAARAYAQQQFAWMGWFITSVIEACDAERVGWRDGRAVMASAFDPDAFAEDGSRKRPGYLFPTPVFATMEDAAREITATLGTILHEYA